jgi:HemY protein
MKAGLLIILVLALGVLVANNLVQENGLVQINYGAYSINMSVFTHVLVMVLAYFVVRLVVRFWQAPRQLGQYVAERRVRKAGERITRGYIELGAGNFARGEKLLTKGARNSETPLLNYLAAARAAQAQGDQKRRDGWLQMALEQEPGAEAAVLFTQAELQLASNETDAAQASLQRVLEQAPKNTAALNLLAEISVDKADWTVLEGLLPRLRKLSKVTPVNLDEWTLQTWAVLLKTKPVNAKRSKNLLGKLPKHLRDDTRILRAEIEACVSTGRVDEAATIIRKALDRQWSDELVELYGALQTPAKAKLLKNVEGWLVKRPEDPMLLLAAGRLCVQNKLWGKARSYFETSLGLSPSPDAWHELGQLLSHMGENVAASDAYQKGLTLSYNGPAIPRLTTDANMTAE